jgi:hypothetical protein
MQILNKIMNPQQFCHPLIQVNASHEKVLGVFTSLDEKET